MLDPRSLMTYLSVCRENSISGAARRLNISQPAVSVTISQLEKTLGVSLFSRSRTGITLTPEGKALMQKAESMEALLNSAEEEVALSKAGVSGPLNIGGTPGALVTLIPDAVERMEKDNQSFALRIVERSDEDLLELLRKGHIEIAVVTTSIGTLPNDIIEHSLMQDSLELIVGKQNKQLPDKISRKELKNLSWVLPKAAGAFQSKVDAVFTSLEMHIPLNAIRCDSLLTTKAIVREGHYVTILPREVVAGELASGEFRAIQLKGVNVKRSAGIRILAGHQLSEMANRLINALFESHEKRR